MVKTSAARLIRLRLSQVRRGKSLGQDAAAGASR
jgi:hypothetical protein